MSLTFSSAKLLLSGTVALFILWRQWRVRPPNATISGVNIKLAAKVRPNVFSLFSIILLAIAYARPSYLVPTNNLLIIVDVSKSMNIKDYRQKNGLASRFKAIDYLGTTLTQQVDTLGLMVFASKVKLLSPLTDDKEFILHQIKDLSLGKLTDDVGSGTSLGDAIIGSINRVKTLTDRHLILISDGDQTSGSISVQDSLNYAKEERVKIHTINLGQSIDKLREISNLTGGEFFNPNSETQLENAVAKIKQQSSNYRKVDLSTQCTYAAIIIYALFILWSRLIFPRYP